MSRQLLLLIVGSSIYAHAVQSALEGLSSLGPVLINPAQRELLTYYLTQQPECIFWETGTLSMRFRWGLVQQGHVLVELDPSATPCSVVCRTQYSLVDGTDIEQLLQRIIG